MADMRAIPTDGTYSGEIAYRTDIDYPTNVGGNGWKVPQNWCRVGVDYAPFEYTPK